MAKVLKTLLLALLESPIKSIWHPGKKIVGNIHCVIHRDHGKKLIRMAVFKALLKAIPLRANKIFSSRMLVIKPLMIANTRINIGLASILEN